MREPGTSAVAERVRALLLDPELPITAKAETLLFAAARTQSLYEVVRPALDAGCDVVCERFHPSTYAYQAVAGGEDRERVRALLEEWAGDPAPDLVIVLDVDPESAAARRGLAPAQPRKRLRQIVLNMPIAVRATLRKLSECFDSPPLRMP